MTSISSRKSVVGRRYDQLVTNRDFAAITAGVSAPGSFRLETLSCDGRKICPARISSPRGGRALFGWRAFPGPTRSAWRPKMGSQCRTLGTSTISVSTISAKYTLRGASSSVPGPGPGVPCARARFRARPVSNPRAVGCNRLCTVIKFSSVNLCCFTLVYASYPLHFGVESSPRLEHEQGAK